MGVSLLVLIMGEQRETAYVYKTPGSISWLMVNHLLDDKRGRTVIVIAFIFMSLFLIL